VAGPLQNRARGLAKIDCHLVRNDVRQRGLSQSGRAKQQRVIERFAAPARGLDEDGELATDLFLADVLGELFRAQCALYSLVLWRCSGGDQAVGFDHAGPAPGQPSGRLRRNACTAGNAWSDTVLTVCGIEAAVSSMRRLIIPATFSMAFTKYRLPRGDITKRVPSG